MSLPPFLRWLSPATTPRVERVQEQVNPTAATSSPTQEDWYWGRLATGAEEDYYWRRLSDNWYMKDLIPTTYLISDHKTHFFPHFSS